MKTCYMVFDSVDLWTNHCLICSEKKPYLCLMCDTVFGEKSEMVEHKLTQHQEENTLIHSGEKPHKLTQPCHKCSNKIVSDEMEHTEKPHICDTCYMIFESKDLLINHHLTCSEKKPSVCLICDMVFPEENEMIQHNLTKYCDESMLIKIDEKPLKLNTILC